jgi:hypothetical protein
MDNILYFIIPICILLISALVYITIKEAYRIRQCNIDHETKSKTIHLENIDKLSAIDDKVTDIKNYLTQKIPSGPSENSPSTITDPKYLFEDWFENTLKNIGIKNFSSFKRVDGAKDKLITFKITAKSKNINFMVSVNADNETLSFSSFSITIQTITNDLMAQLYKLNTRFGYGKLVIVQENEKHVLYVNHVIPFVNYNPDVISKTINTLIKNQLIVITTCSEYQLSPLEISINDLIKKKESIK